MINQTFETLLSKVDDEGICVLTINRPEKLNALNNQVFMDLELALSKISNDESIKLLVITGAQNKAFVAGADIKEFSEFDSEKARNLSSKGQQVFQKIEDLNKPVIAAINGFALGGGCELAMACHLRVASTNARLGLPEVSLGLIPGYGGTQRLIQLIGRAKALELTLSGRFITAQEAYQIGLINHMGESAMDEAMKLAKLIVKQAPLALKNVILAINSSDSIHGYQNEAKLFGELFETEDFKEGTSAFFEKRKPVFSGK